jgi:hypothetical protein
MRVVHSPRAIRDLEQRTGKSRDMTAAVRQFRQALGNERWLEEEEEETKNP